MHTAQTNKTHTPFVVFFLAFHSSSCAFVLASTFTSRFLSPICRSWSSRKARNVDSGSLYSQKPKAGTHIGMEIDMRTWSNVYLQSEFRVCHGSKCSSTYNVHFVYYKLPWSLPEAPWTLFQLRTIPHFCKVREKKESCQLQKMSFFLAVFVWDYITTPHYINTDRICDCRFPSLTANSCLISMSEAFSDMFPTNTVVVGPLFSSSLAFMAAISLLGIAGLLTTGSDETITAGVGVMIPMWTGIIGAPGTRQRTTPFHMTVD